MVSVTPLKITIGEHSLQSNRNKRSAAIDLCKSSQPLKQPTD